jgi:alpha-tubulin suppressor-like RCC1 family protein
MRTIDGQRSWRAWAWAWAWAWACACWLGGVACAPASHDHDATAPDVDAGADATGRLPVLVAGGGAHTCARSADDVVACWGSDRSGELGFDGPTQTTPTAVPSLGPTRALTAGGAGGSGNGGHTCAVDGSGAVLCWGANDFGQLGDGTRTARATPAPVAGISGAIAIAAGRSHTCAIDGSGTVPGAAGVEELAAGTDHTCARGAGGAVSCWGRNAYGEVGSGDRLTAPAPVSVAGLPPAVSIAAGGSASCAVAADGSARCWGDDQYGQLGDGAGGPGAFYPVPVLLTTNTPITKITLGGAHGCALRNDGTLTCWGSNAVGQLARNDVTFSASPLEVPNIGMANDIFAGTSASFVVIEGGHITAWGANDSGQLGDGTMTNAFTPVPVLPLP